MIPTLLTDTVSHDIDRAFHYALLWGFEGVELRSVGSPDARVPNVNMAKLGRRLRASELSVTGVVPGLFEGSIHRKVAWLNDLELLKDVIRFCEQVGCRMIVVSAFSVDGGGGGVAGEAALHERAASALRTAAKLTALREITLAVLNENGTICRTAGELAALIRAVDHPNCRAAWSPAESVLAGEDPVAACLLVVGGLSAVRLRDVREQGGSWLDVTPGTGVVPWAEVIEHLTLEGYEGPVSVEVRGEPKAQEGFRASEFLHQLLRGSRRRAPGRT